jgi:hypothetical protein
MKTNLVRSGSMLEEAFFINEDKKLIEKMHQLEKLNKTKEEYTNVSGIKNSKVLDKFVQLKLPVAIVACLEVIPLIEVAWADGKIDKKEKELIPKNSDKFGITENSVEYELLCSWLNHKPNDTLLDAWIHYISGLCEELTTEERDGLKTETMSHVRELAKVSGGIFGFGNKISSSEKMMIDKLERAFV